MFVGLKRYVSIRLITMFGVLLATLFLTVALVGSNMDTILKQGVIFQVRAEMADNPSIAESFVSIELSLPRPW